MVDYWMEVEYIVGTVHYIEVYVASNTCGGKQHREVISRIQCLLCRLVSSASKKPLGEVRIWRLFSGVGWGWLSLKAEQGRAYDLLQQGWQPPIKSSHRSI
jgi:hypothetical protein